MKEVSLMPAVEFFPEGLDKERALKKIREEGHEFLSKLKKKGQKETYYNFSKKLKSIEEFVLNESFFPGYEQLLPYFIEEKHTLLAYFTKPPWLVFDEPGGKKKVVRPEKEKFGRFIWLFGKKARFYRGKLIII